MHAQALPSRTKNTHSPKVMIDGSRSDVLVYIDVDMLLSSFGLINVFLDAAMKRSTSVLWLRDGYAIP